MDRSHELSEVIIALGGILNIRAGRLMNSNMKRMAGLR